MPQLRSEARITLRRPAELVAAIASYLSEHDVECHRRGDEIVAELGVGTGAFAAVPGAMNVRVEADDLGDLESLRSLVASNLVPFAGEEPTIVWRGHVANGETFANFREVRLKSAVAVSPRMRRLTFVGDIARFASDDDIHVRCYFPPAGLDRPEWPRPAADGRTIWPDEARRPEVRYYTVRRVDVSAGEIDLDFVLHDNPGPGACFAETAKTGAICGLAGPLGRTAPRAAWTLLAGDETALPAIARILETMPRSAVGSALIEIGTDADRIPIFAPRGFEVNWLRRGPRPAGEPTLLLDAIAGVTFPQHDDLFVWAACEIAVAKAIRAHLRTTRRLSRERHLVVGYWAKPE